ncbi:MAG: hypothetical protein WKF30_02500 [Pyrinomonadaceae bacterium]
MRLAIAVAVAVLTLNPSSLIIVNFSAAGAASVGLSAAGWAATGLSAAMFAGTVGQSFQGERIQSNGRNKHQEVGEDDVLVINSNPCQAGYPPDCGSGRTEDQAEKILTEMIINKAIGGAFRMLGSGVGAIRSFLASRLGRGAAREGTERVGRWMSEAEYNAMRKTGMVQESFSGTTHVARPANPEAFAGTK